MFRYFYLVVFIILLNWSDAYKLLVVFPIPGKSHSILGEGYVKQLLKAGHEVTYVTPILLKNSSPKLRQIDVSSNFGLLPVEEYFSLDKLMNKKSEIINPAAIVTLMAGIANGTVMHENIQKLLLDTKEAFDAVIVEWMFNEIYAGFSTVFNCPLIWSSSMEPHQMVLTLIDEDPNPAYTADVFSSEVPPFTFWQRAAKLVGLFQIKFGKWTMSSADRESYKNAFSAAVSKRGHMLPSLDEVKYNASVMLGNSHVSAGQPIRLPQNYIPIAGYHIDEKVKPLPKDLQLIMDNAEHGVIYFSMGSMLKSNSLPENVKRNLLDMFQGLKQTIIWKFEEKLQNLPKNVHILEWAPQQSILAHPKCIIFITHGGLLSTTETLHFGVPIIGIPMFADQFFNVNRATDKGFAKRVDLNLDTPLNLKAAIEAILENPRYREKVKELSLVYHDRVATPAAELVHWVEHVVRTRGAPHLRSPALHVPLYQKMYLDLAAVILVTIFITVQLIKQFLLFKSRDGMKKKLS